MSSRFNKEKLTSPLRAIYPFYTLQVTFEVNTWNRSHSTILYASHVQSWQTHGEVRTLMECWEASCLDHTIQWAGNSEPAMPQSKLQQDECQWKRCAKVWSLFPINLGRQEDNGLAKPFDWGLGICAALKARFCNGVVWGLNTDFNYSWFLLKVLIPETC